jgi:mono/diheme cytochrome c family protein
MRSFFWGVFLTIVLILVGAYLIVKLGYVNFAADQESSAIERHLAMTASDASMERHAPAIQNPLTATDDTLVAGAKLYRDNCAGCHGSSANPDAAMGHAFNPPAPQFMADSADMADNLNFYIIRHGIRWTGMPAWKAKFNDEQIWQLVTFLKHMDKLPPSAEKEIRQPPSPSY